MLNLSGNWTLRDAQGSYCLPMALPGDSVSALLAAGEIADPYYGRNEYDVRWIAERDWIVSRNFDMEIVAGQRYDFDVSELDCVADISINSTKILSAKNVFRFFSVDVTDILKSGANEIEIYFHSNTVEANRLQDIQPYPVPYQEGNCDIPNGNMLRKVQCDFGWDWGVALAPFGVYGDICIRPVSVRVEQVSVVQTHADGMVELAVEALLSGEVSGQAYVVEFDGQTLAGTTDGAKLQLNFKIEKPKIWWPVGSGEQPLYELKLKVGAWNESRKIGLRTIELETLDDKIGKSFVFKVNGENIFMRGANWIPADALPSKITDEATLDLLQSAVDANMNMIRVWGGGRYEADSFYEQCSELGLLVWQDFMYSCNIYPSDPEFLDEVAIEVGEQVARLSHHACLALWCGDNELVGALTWYEETRKNRDLYLVGYDRLNRVIEQAMNKTDENAVWWPSSPSSGPMNFGDAWHDDSSGDMHYWSVWHEGKSFDNYYEIKPRFCSEFGFQSFPSMNVVRSFADEKDWNIASSVMESHQKNAGGNARIAETMFRYFRFPEGFENFVYVSQIQQGLAIRTAVEFWRSLKPHCMGTLYWQLNDTWPVASWASLDYGGDWKLMHYMVKRFYQSVAVSIIPEGDTLKVMAVNDTLASAVVEVELSLIDMDGKATLLQNASGAVSSNAAESLVTLKQSDIKDGQILSYRFKADNGMAGADHYTPLPYKQLDLSDPDIAFTTRIDGDSIIVNINCQGLALFVTLEAEVEGRYSDNCFMMLAGESREVKFTPRGGKLNEAMQTFIVRDLYSATYKK
ncbi:MAG: glycoside hydrolase family 2 protein [Alphaproteobacteria bacterium]|nr:glycoside hydrolase family 2 protein [Alphaproteobacteria bacterium]